MDSLNMDESNVSDVPEEYRSIYRKHYNAIKTRVTKGRIKYVYHFLIAKTYDRSLVDGFLSTIRTAHKNGYKLNAAFGLILRNTRTDELRFFHPSLNNMVFELPRIVKDLSDYQKILEDLEKEDILNSAKLHRPSTAWNVAKIVCVRFDVYKTSL